MTVVASNMTPASTEKQVSTLKKIRKKESGNVKTRTETIRLPAVPGVINHIRSKLLQLKIESISGCIQIYILNYLFMF